MINQDEAWLLEEKYNGKPSPAYHEDLARLQAGEPLAYIIGHVPFLGCTIWLDSHPLIPRPETEFWVEKAIAAIAKRGTKEASVLDLCAGSGCIGVAVAKTIPTAHVTFAEIDPDHLSTIEKNINANSGTALISWKGITSDLFNNITEKYDFILSNPPYIDPALDRTEVSVKDFEPHLALYGGAKGTELIERIIAEAPAHLNPHGELWLEHEPEQAEAIATIGTAAGFLVTTHNDQFKVKRYSVLVLQ